MCGNCSGYERMIMEWDADSLREALFEAHLDIHCLLGKLEEARRIAQTYNQQRRTESGLSCISCEKIAELLKKI
jgi:hypothetical protein